jgi:gamma-glutamyl:cysteine ligase YbdK (ATP-grasp superfamily)
MKIGIEEEFIAVDPETLFCIPGAFRLANAMVYRDFSNVKKYSVELPLHPRFWSDIIKNIGTAFSVFEIKTDPYEDVDKLKDELQLHRNNVADAAKENHLMVLPTGLHPSYSPDSFIPDNCAALHVHVDYQKDVLTRLYEKIPFLISISANSPFFDGKPGLKSNRLRYSPAIKIPTEVFRRGSYIIYNKFFNTIEVRVLDSQVTVSDSIGVASVIKAIAEQEGGCRAFDIKEYTIKRERAMSERVREGLIPLEEYEHIFTYNEYAKRLLEVGPGSEWQLKIYKKYGLSSVIVSLWESFCADKRKIASSNLSIDSNNSSLFDLLFFIPYFPFFIIDKVKKRHQDIGSGIRLENLVSYT